MKHFFIVLSVCFFTIVFSFSASVHAATVMVTNVNDSGAGSLRQAVLDVQALPAGAHTIDFDPTFFNTPRTITLAGSYIHLSLTGGFYDVSINGPGANLLTVNGNNLSRVFYVNSSGIIRISGMTVTGGRAAGGGGLYSQSELHLTNMTFTANTSTGAPTEPNINRDSAGGAIYSFNTMFMTNCQIINNHAVGFSSHSNPNLPPYGSPASAGGIFINFGGDSYIINSVISGNTVTGGNAVGAWAGGSGGGAAGGGILIGSSSPRIINSTISNNVVTGGTGNLNGAGGGAEGGGISGSNVLIYGTTISNNSVTAGNGGGGVNGNIGGTARAGGLSVISGHIINSTISNNFISRGTGHVNGECQGGGVYHRASELRFLNVTIANNNVPGCQGGGIYRQAASSSPARGSVPTGLGNSIVAGNTAQTGNDIWGSVEAHGNNLIGIGNDMTGIVNGVDGNQVGTLATPLNPQIGPLTNNGGATNTHALQAGSPAINAGKNSSLTYFNRTDPVLGDQRGLARVFPTTSGTVDIGAFEFGATTVTAPSGRPDMRPESDSGGSTTDNITNNRAPVFDVIGMMPGTTVDLLRNGTVVASIAARDLSVTLTDPAPPLDGVASYAIRQTVQSVGTSDAGPALSVTFDNTAPALTIEQAATQSDPGTTQPIRFTVTFSEQFAQMSSTPWELTGSTAHVANTNFFFTGSNLVRTLEISQIRSAGLVVLSMPANKFRDTAGNSNVASTSVDNVVDYQPVRQLLYLSGRISRSSGGVAQISHVIVTDAFSGHVYRAAVLPSGHYRVTGIAKYQGFPTLQMTIQVFRKQRSINPPVFFEMPTNLINADFDVAW